MVTTPSHRDSAMLPSNGPTCNDVLRWQEDLGIGFTYVTEEGHRRADTLDDVDSQEFVDRSHSGLGRRFELPCDRAITEYVTHGL